MISEQIISTIQAMCHQEQTGYSCSDYLHQYNQQQQHQQYQQNDDNQEGQQQHKKIAVNQEVRAKLVDWCYSIVDFCKFNRETVAISISYLDRFLLTELGLVTLQEPTIFQLASMTALYTAIKIHEPEAMDPELVSNLSHGAYTIEQVEAMEFAILQAINWRVNTPTALAFVRHYLDLLPNRVLDKATKSAAYDLTINQTEFAVRDYKFITVKASAVAYVSLMNSLESLCIDSKTYDYVSHLLSKVSNIDPDARHIIEMQTYLYPRVSDHPYFDETHGCTTTMQDESSCSDSKSVASSASLNALKNDHRATHLGKSPCSAFENISTRSS